MEDKNKLGAPGAGYLRTRYVPGVRIRQGLLAFLPWLDLLLLLQYLILLQARIVLQPGLVVELPDGGSGQGLYSPLIAVAVVAGTVREPVVKVYFDNEPYLLDDEQRMAALREALAARRQRRGESALTLYADRRIEHRHMTLLMQMAQEAGMQRINLGIRPAAVHP